MPTASLIPAPPEMDPEASMPKGDFQQLPPVQAIDPFAAVKAAKPSAASATKQPTQKPLRGPKERQPVATRLDLKQVRNAAQALAPSSPPPAAPTGAFGVAPTHSLTVTSFLAGKHNGTTIPPDTSGAVGKSHIFTAHNNTVTIFDRSGHPLLTTTLDAFWAAQGHSGDTFDPRVAYDPAGDRFIFVAMLDAQKPTSALLVAVSKSGDPTLHWVSVAIQVDDAAQGQVWLDFPSVGFTADKMTVQVNVFSRAANRFIGSAVYAFDKNSLYHPPHAPVYLRFDIKNQGGTHVPATTYDSGVADQFLLSRWGGNINGSGSLLVYRITGDVNSNTAKLIRIGYVVSRGNDAWESFSPGDMGPQNGSAGKIDVGDDRLLSVVYRNGRIYCSQVVLLPVGTPTRSASQWWEIDPSAWTLNELARVDDPTGKTLFAFPTLAVNARGDMLIGQSQFTATTFASASFSFRASGQALFPPQVFAAGKASYFVTFSGTKNRWGDYSATVIDPLDPLSFWTLQEYAEAPQNTWATRWAKITITGGTPVSGGSVPIV